MFVIHSWNPLGLCCLLRLVFWDLSAAHRDISWAVTKLHGKHVSCFFLFWGGRRIKHKKENSRNLFVCIWFPLAQKLFLVENHNILQKKSNLVQKGLGTVLLGASYCFQGMCCLRYVFLGKRSCVSHFLLFFIFKRIFFRHFFSLKHYE